MAGVGTRVGRSAVAALAVALSLAVVACGDAEPSAAPDPGVSSTPVAVPTGPVSTVVARPSPGCAAPDVELATTADHPNGVGSVAGAFSLTVPTGRTGDPLPLVVDMHGALGTRAGEEAASGLGALGMEQGFITLSPQAPSESRVWRLGHDGPDVAFVQGLVDIASERLCVDLARIYATGFSMGGMMSMELACATPDRYAAIAPVAGTVEVQPCDRADPVPLLSVHGSGDDVVGFDGTLSPNVAVMVGPTSGASVSEVVTTWAEVNGCAVPGGAAPDATEVTATVDQVHFDCPPTGSTELYVVDGGGHDRPGDPTRGGDGSDGFVASAAIWSFFQQHARG